MFGYLKINKKMLYVSNDLTFKSLRVQHKEIINIAKNKKETVLKEKNYIKKLRRTVNILMQILDIKRKLQIETRKNYDFKE